MDFLLIIGKVCLFVSSLLFFICLLQRTIGPIMYWSTIGNLFMGLFATDLALALKGNIDWGLISGSLLVFGFFYYVITVAKVTKGPPFENLDPSEFRAFLESKGQYHGFNVLLQKLPYFIFFSMILVTLVYVIFYM